MPKLVKVNPFTIIIIFPLKKIFKLALYVKHMLPYIYIKMTYLAYQNDSTWRYREGGVQLVRWRITSCDVELMLKVLLVEDLLKRRLFLSPVRQPNFFMIRNESSNLTSSRSLLLFRSFCLDQGTAAASRDHHKRERLRERVGARRFENREAVVWTHQRNHLDLLTLVHPRITEKHLGSRAYWRKYLHTVVLVS